MQNPVSVFVLGSPKGYSEESTAIAATLQHLKNQGAQIQIVGTRLHGFPLPLRWRQVTKIIRTPPAPHVFHILHVIGNDSKHLEMCMRAFFVRRILKLPVRILLTSSITRPYKLPSRYLNSKMDATIATSEKAVKFSQNVCAVIPRGVDIDIFRPVDDRKKSWEKLGFGGQIGIAVFGSISPGRCLDFFVESAIKFLPSYPDTRVLIIGFAPAAHLSFEQRLKTMVSNAGMTNQIIFTHEMDQIKRQQVIPTLSAVFNTSQYSEGSFVTLQAAACGVPIVLPPLVSKNDNTDAVVDEPFSLTIRSGAASEMDYAMRAILSRSPDEISELGGLARKKTVDCFSVSQEAEAIYKIYTRLCSNTLA